MLHRIASCLAVTSLLLVSVPGCDSAKVKQGAAGDASGSSAAAPAAASDPIAAAAADAEPDERPFLEPSRAFLTALAARNYAAAYDQLSSHAKAKICVGQFTPSAVTETSFGTPLENVTREQFVEWMGKCEAELGVPAAIRDISVFEIDPKVLAGEGDKLSVMFAIGAMPAEIPANIRKASLRGSFVCQKSKAWAEAMAQQLEEKVTADQILAGQVNQESKETLEDSLPYMNLKFVLVEEGGQLKVGHFEMMPPSMLD